MLLLFLLLFAIFYLFLFFYIIRLFPYKSPPYLHRGNLAFESIPPTYLTYM